MNRSRRLVVAASLASISFVCALTARAAPVPGELYGALSWRCIGPWSGGRVEAVAGSAAQPNVFYMGSAGGGVWKSLDYGLNWTNVSDGYLDTGVIGALAMAPSDPAVVYAGTGEPFPRGDVAPGDGLYRSPDGGKTWHKAGLADTRIISAIAIDPHDPNHLYVAALGDVFGAGAARGVYETRDGGAHWKKILFVNDRTGAVALVMDPADPRVLYAALWQVRRRPWLLTDGGPGSGLYKSADGGAHWQEISSNPGFATGTLGKIGIAVSAADPSRVYAIVEAEQGGVYRSDDAGATWERVNSSHEFRQRAFYYTTVYADPADKDTIYLPQVESLFKSTDGGKTFKALGTLAHGDNHVLWINPENPRLMIEGNDGGAEVTQNGGASWTLENDQPTAQFYHVYVDNQFPYRVYGSQQDRGSVSIPSRTSGDGISAYDWFAVGDGESGYIATPPDRPWVVYTSGYYSSIYRYDRRSGQIQNVDVWPVDQTGHGADRMKYRFQWTFPIVIPPNDPGTIYATSQYVMKSTDEGMSWQTISPDLTRNDKSRQRASGGPLIEDNSGTETYDTIFALAVSPLDRHVIWAGTDDGLVWITRDGGAHWKNVTPQGLPDWTTVSIVEASHFESGTAYLAAHRYRLDDFAPYIYKTTDYGAHWEKIVRGLPDDQSSFTVREDTGDPGLLFAGTFQGVYVSFDGGADWQSLRLNMPATPVRDLAIQARENDLVAATHGRGFWIMDDLGALRQIARGKVSAQDAAYLFAPEHAYVMTPAPEHPGSVPKYEGENPPDGAAIFYYLGRVPARGEPVRLSVLDPEGRTVVSYARAQGAGSSPAPSPATGFFPVFESYPPPTGTASPALPARAGMNRVVWNLRYPGATPIPGVQQVEGDLVGPHAVPGIYRVRLQVGDRAYTQPLTVLADLRAQTSDADLRAQFDLLMKVHDTLETMNRAILRERAVRSRLEGYMEDARGQANADRLATLVQPVIAKLGLIEGELIQADATVGEDNLWYPIRLESRLEYFNAAVGSSLTRPTQQEYAVYAELSAQVQAQLKRLDAVYAQDLPALDESLTGMGLAPVTPPAAATHGG